MADFGKSIPRLGWESKGLSGEESSAVLAEVPDGEFICGYSVELTAGAFVLILFLAPCSVHHTAEVADTVVKRDSRTLSAGFKFNVHLVPARRGIGKDEDYPTDSVYWLAAKEMQFVGCVQVGCKG